MSRAKRIAARNSDEGMLLDIFRKYYFSSVFAIICSCMGSIVGNIVIGNALGEQKLAVVSLVLPLYYVFATVGNLAGIGGSALCAKQIGQNDREGCRRTFTATYLLTVGLCALFSLLFLLLLPRLIVLLGTPEALQADVMAYARVMVLGGMFIAGIYLSFNMLRLDDKPVATTLTFVLMVVVTVLLDFILVRFDMTGISIANIAGSAAAALFGVIFIVKKSTTLGFVKMSGKEFGSACAQILKVGSPGATENASILVKSYLLNRLIVAMIGSAALSSLSVVNSVNSFSQSITVGCAGALVPLLSVFSAERDTVSMRRIIRVAMRVSLVLLVVFAAVVFVFAPQVARLFGIVEGAAEAAKAVRLFALSLPLALAANVLLYLHLANSHTALANVLTLFHSLIWAIASAFLLMKGLGETGLWLSFAACEAATLLTAALLHFLARRRNPDLSPILLIDTKYEKSGASIALSLPDTEEGIADALQQLEAFGEQNELPPKRQMLITLSMDEMMHLAMQYSTCESKRHIISLRVLINPGVLVLRLRYDGKKFNPIAYYEEKKSDTQDIDAMLALADMLGMKLVTDTCDVVDYRATFGINNLTVII